MTVPVVVEVAGLPLEIEGRREDVEETIVIEVLDDHSSGEIPGAEPELGCDVDEARKRDVRDVSADVDALSDRNRVRPLADAHRCDVEQPGRVDPLGVHLLREPGQRLDVQLDRLPGAVPDDLNPLPLDREDATPPVCGHVAVVGDAHALVSECEIQNHLDDLLVRQERVELRQLVIGSEVVLHRPLDVPRLELVLTGVCIEAHAIERGRTLVEGRELNPERPDCAGLQVRILLRGARARPRPTAPGSGTWPFQIARRGARARRLWRHWRNRTGGRRSPPPHR